MRGGSREGRQQPVFAVCAVSCHAAMLPSSASSEEEQEGDGGLQLSCQAACCCSCKPRLVDGGQCCCLVSDQSACNQKIVCAHGDATDGESAQSIHRSCSSE